MTVLPTPKILDEMIAEGVSKKEKTTIKGLEIAKLVDKTKRFSVNQFIEIDEVKATDFGLELFVRAFDAQGNAKGFGKNGEIETERIRFFTADDETLLLVPDVNGDIERIVFVDGNPFVQKFRFDPQEAFRRRLDYVVKNISRSGENIQKNSRGNTVTVIDYDSTNSYHVAADAKASYTLARDASTADAAYQTTTNSTHNCMHNTFGGSYFVRRPDFVFNTSVLAGQVVTGLTFTAWTSASGGGDADNDTVGFLDNTNQAGLSLPLATEDMNDFPSSAIFTEDWTGWNNQGANKTSGNFPSYGVVNVNGNTRIGLRFGRDLSNTAPTGSNIMRLQTGSSGDNPYITVTHSAAPTANTGFLQFM